jgi:hypothetical protein
LYVYDNGFNRKDFEGSKWVELKDIPEPILEIYREVNRGV